MTFRMSAADTIPALGGILESRCWTSDTTRIGRVTDCMNPGNQSGVLAAFRGAALLHEQAHITCNAGRITTTSSAITAPEKIEQLVGTSVATLQQRANSLADEASRDIIDETNTVLHASGGTSFSLYFFLPSANKWQHTVNLRTSCS